MKTLVVDDNATSREILKDILESFSFEVALAASGEEGLTEIENAAGEKPFELVVMDWKMPVMDGYEATRRIRKWQSVSANADSDGWETEDRGQRTERKPPTSRLSP